MQTGNAVPVIHAATPIYAAPPRRINEIVHGKRRISADTALRLARYFRTSKRFWMNLQGRYDLEVERDHLASVLEERDPSTRQRLSATRAWVREAFQLQPCGGSWLR
jgi:addiction module HigA family antidote